MLLDNNMCPGSSREGLLLLPLRGRGYMGSSKRRLLQPTGGKCTGSSKQRLLLLLLLLLAGLCIGCRSPRLAPLLL